MKGQKCHFRYDDIYSYDETIQNNQIIFTNQYYYCDDIKGEYIWIEESKSIKAKIDLAKKYGTSGIGFWCLGQETTDVWSAFGS